jgi:ubiquinone biosynthesis protein
MVLMRHGFFELVSRIGLGGLVPATARVAAVGRPGEPPDWPDRVPLVLTDLGTTFIKLGQVASTRSDLFPPRLTRALEQLQDHVPAIPIETIAHELEAAWGVDPKAVLWLDPRPLASASIAQVHAGRLPDGREVVVKVRRPGLLETATVDCEIVADLASVAERRFSWAREYGFAALVAELVRAFQDELDFRVEARNTKLAAEHAAADPGVRIPEVVEELSGEGVLVLSRLRGIKITDRHDLLEAGGDPHALAQRLVATLYREIFLDGFFHADPHPGNVHVDAVGHLLLLDWGMVGRLAPSMREHSVDLLLGMARGRPELVVRALLRLGAVEKEVDRRALSAEVEKLRRRYYERSLAEFELGQAITDLLALAARHRIRIPHEYALLAKAAVTLDGLVRRLDPQASLVDLGRPLMGQLLRARLGPEAIERALEGNLLQWLFVWEELPHGIQRLMDRIDRGEVRVTMEQANLERVLGHWEKLLNRLGLAWVLGALLVGTALVVHPGTVDRLAGLPAGEYVFLGAVALSLWALIMAVRRGHL